MLLSNVIQIDKYAIGTFLNFILTLLFFSVGEINTIFTFFTLLVISQACLLLFGMRFLGINFISVPIPTFILGIAKLMLLVIAFFIGLNKLGDYGNFLVITYIFQLIILAISIKRIVKKN